MLIMSQYIIPTILIILDIGSAIVYAFEGDKGRVLYWISAAFITYSTFLMK